MSAGVPDAIYSMFFDGKEYFVNSSSEGRGFTNKVAFCCSLTMYEFGFNPKYFILLFFLHISNNSSLYSPSPYICNSESGIFALSKPFTSISIPYLRSNIPAYIHTFFEYFFCSEILFSPISMSTIPSIII